MASKREEERNEKIIRGLMKLPPNRRCINCNNLGPQYVCTNFWTFVCMICSGIHREFTHRVKSVSMSKFTSQEVDALQNGGNQRAREIYLKDWDLQRQRLPNSSDVDKVREFIKAVYVSRNYAGGNKSEKPASDVQGERDVADETRRASSYHSYSQSPPYDFQYEERLYRKQGGSLNRKPGSDRGLFDRKAASFVYSPGRFSDHIYEDRFANEGSSSRVSDYSVSSGGEPFRSAPQSPNLQKENVLASLTSNSSRETADGLQRQISSTKLEAVPKKEADKISVPHPQRTVSSGTITENKVSSFPPSSPLSTEISSVSPLGIPVPISAPAIELFQASTTVDLFQSSEVSSVPSKNLRVPQTSVSSSLRFFPDTSENSYAQRFNEKLSELSESINEGWATFESHQPPGPSILTTVDSGSQSEVGISAEFPDSVSSSNVGSQWLNVENGNLHVSASLASHLWNEDLQNTHASTMASSQSWIAFEEVDKKEHKHVEEGIDLQFSAEHTFCTTGPSLGSKTAEPPGPSILKTVDSGSQADVGNSAKHPDSFSSANAVLQWQNVQSTNVHVSASLASHLSNGDWQSIQSSTMASCQPWNAFEEVNEKEHKHVEEQGIDLQFSAERTSCTTDHNLGPKTAEAPSVDGLQKLASNDGFSFPTLPPHVPSSFQFNPSIHPFTKSSNPFDSPFDSEFEGNNGFFGMNNLQAALPSMPLSSPYTGGLDESWFPPSPIGSQGGMSYIAAQAPATQLTNIPAHGPVASVGGNPFA